jgi:hypothetical protein
MPNISYLPASFGAWVEGTGFPPDMGCQINRRPGEGVGCWEVLKGDELVAQLYVRSAEVYSPEVDRIIISLAMQFEELFISNPSKDGVAINCHFPKFMKKDQ